MLLEERQMRRFDFLGSSKFWAWGLAILLALAAMYALLALKPVTQLNYNAGQLIGAVPDKLEYGLYAPETDPAGQRYRWLSGSSILIFPVNSDTPIKITLRLRSAGVAGGPNLTTSIILNDVPITKITPGNEFKDYTLALTPAYNDKHRLNFLLTSPTWSAKGDPRKLSNMIESVSIDFNETWSPVLRPGRAWLFWLLPLLAVVCAGLVIAASSGNVLARYASYGAVLVATGAVALMLLWLILLARVGYNGEATKNVFWLWVASSAYLTAFFGWVALDGVSLGGKGKPSIWQGLRNYFAPWILAHPALAALIGLFLLNFVFTGIFYARVFIEAGSLAPIVRYLDGPEYFVTAHQFYDLNDPLRLTIPDFKQHSLNYWTTRFPGYTIALRLVWYIVGWEAAGPLVNFLASTLFAFVFWKFLREFGYVSRPFWVAAVSLVLPLRWLIYHSVGASEPLMMLFQLLSIYFFKKERYWLAGLAGAAALFTRSPGIFLWVGYMLWLLWEASSRMWKENRFNLSYVNWKAFFGVSLIPLTLPVIFGIYAWHFGDFLAYLRVDEEVLHVGLFPFPSVADGGAGSTGVFYYYLIEVVGLALLWKQGRRDLFWIGLGTVAYTFFLLHPDVLRYSLPAFPLILAIPFAEQLSGKVARWLALPVLVAIYLYSWGALNTNLIWLETWQMLKNILG